MAKKVVLAVIAVMVVGGVFIALSPAEYEVRRSLVVRAPAAIAYGWVADFRRWDAWSPWARLDPAMGKELTGPGSGVGATYRWAGDDRVGAGRMTIVAARPAAELAIAIELTRPASDVARTAFRFEPAGPLTTVSWSLSGRLGFGGKAMRLVKSVDAMIGADLERGLAALAAVAEGEARAASAGAAAGPAAEATATSGAR